MGLTKRQYKYYRIIKEYIQTNGFSPTIREINEMVGVSSSATTNDMLYRLKEKGYINFIPRKARTITLCDTKL
jgi:repressor LexA